MAIAMAFAFSAEAKKAANKSKVDINKTAKQDTRTEQKLVKTFSFLKISQTAKNNLIQNITKGLKKKDSTVSELNITDAVQKFESELSKAPANTKNVIISVFEKSAKKIEKDTSFAEIIAFVLNFHTMATKTEKENYNSFMAELKKTIDSKPNATSALETAALVYKNGDAAAAKKFLKELRNRCKKLG